MKRVILAVAVASLALPALAETAAPDIPQPKCDPKPEYPGRLAMQVDSRRHSFEREIKAYRECMQKYIDERKAATSANAAAGNAAIEDYNAVMKKINEDQKAAADQ